MNAPKETTKDAVKVPFIDLRAQYAGLRQEIRAAIDGVLESQHFVLGPHGEALEHDLAAYCDAKYAVALANGTDALTIALAACGIGPGDEVIVPTFTFVATATAVVRLGARPVFADIDPATFNLDPAEIERRLTPQTKAVMPVHLYGLPAEMETINAIAARHRLYVIEDNAQAIGARYKSARTGSLGIAAGISFYPTKNLGAYGDGGMMVTNSEKLAAHARRLRDHGQSGKYHCAEPGWNSRLDEIQAAVLRIKLQRLDDWTAARRAHAQRYNELLAGVPGITTPNVPAHSEHVYHLYTIRILGESGRRDRVQQQLASLGISTSAYYPTPLHLQPVFAEYGHKPDSFPVSEQASAQVLSLPLFPELTNAQIERVVESLATALKETT
jgi:dTDP-4-amino-4,6-dideoxygalactose transaminase